MLICSKSHIIQDIYTVFYFNATEKQNTWKKECYSSTKMPHLVCAQLDVV